MEETIHLACPQCHAVNRVPRSRLDQGPSCGKCHAPILPPRPLHLDANGLDALAAKGELPLLVDFWAPWCGPCRTMAPQFEQAAALLHPRVLLAKVDTEQNQELAFRYGIQSIPTMVLFKGGRDVARVSGAMSAQAIAEWVRPRL